MLCSSVLTWLAAAVLTRSAAAVAMPVAETVKCTRSFLKKATDVYMAAQSQGKPHVLLVLAGASANVSYTEDDIRGDIARGVLTMPLKIDHNASLLDTTQCATYTELIVTDARHPRVIGTQMRFGGGGDGGNGRRLASVQTIVTEPGDWGFNATQTLHYASAETAAGFWGPIEPATARNSRATIQAAADAYMDLFGNKSVTVPWGTPCDRLEGSWYTGNGSRTDSCDIGVPSGIHLTHRRYVIDEVVGGVDAMVHFETLPDSHEFLVEHGKIRLVHTMTVMRNVTGLGTARRRARRRSGELWRV